MKTSTIVWIGIAIIVILGGWWLLAGSKAPAEAPAPAAAAGDTQAAGNPAKYVDGNLLLGTDGAPVHLIGYNGMTLYTFNKDTATASACAGACAAAWPPYVVGSADALANLQAGVTGTVTTLAREDGSVQVVYNGHPLYFWIQDTKSGDATGDGINGFAIAKP